MIYKWNYKHNIALPSGQIVNCPDSKLRGNVCYIAKWGYANQAAVDLVDPTAQIGSLDYPFNSFTNYKATIATHLIYLSVIDKGVYEEGGFEDLSLYTIVGDSLHNAIFQGNGAQTFATYIGNPGGRNGVYRLRFKNYTSIKSAYSPISMYFCFCESRVYQYGNTTNAYIQNCIILADFSEVGGNEKQNYYFNNNVSFGITVNEAVYGAIFYNSAITLPSINIINHNSIVIYNGSITVGANTYDLSMAIALDKDEGTIQSEIGTLFGVTFVGRIINPHPINAAKGNFNMDYINYASDVNTILTAQSSYPNVVKKGIKLEWNNTISNSDFIFDETHPNFSVNDGFGGLKCYNLNQDGTIIDVNLDVIAVSKIYTLSEMLSLYFASQFGKIGAGYYDFDEIYVRAVLTGNVKDTYNNANYNISYSTGVASCDLPRMFFNREQKVNKIGDMGLGNIDLGNYDINEARNIFRLSALEFQFIFIKRGV